LPKPRKVWFNSIIYQSFANVPLAHGGRTDMSKKAMWTAVITLHVALGMGSAWAADTKSDTKPADAKPAAPKDAGYNAFAALKQLAGDWRGEAPPGQLPAVIRFRIEERDSVLSETFFPGTPEQMVTMYHLDGPNLVATHYCTAGNQPQLKLNAGESKIAGPSSSAGSYVFEYVGATNLRGNNDFHMGGYTLTVVDDNHIASIHTLYKGSLLLDSGKTIFERVEPIK
jgi:hypothetical protein